MVPDLIIVQYIVQGAATDLDRVLGVFIHNVGRYGVIVTSTAGAEMAKCYICKYIITPDIDLIHSMKAYIYYIL